MTETTAKLLDPDNWLQGILVRKYYNPRQPQGNLHKGKMAGLTGNINKPSLISLTVMNVKAQYMK